MKESIKKVSIIFATILLTCALLPALFKIPTNHCAAAEVAVPVSQVETVEDKENTIRNDEVAVSLGDTSYQYYAPQTASFFLEAVEGVAFFNEDAIIISYNGVELIIPDFDFYRLLDTQDEVMFYQADVAKDTSQNESYAYVAATPNMYGKYELKVHYGVKENLTLYIIRASLTDEMLHFIDAKSNDLHICDDEISERLKASSKAYMQGMPKNFESEQTFDANRAATCALNAIKEYTYDSYTDTDENIYLYSTKTKLMPTENSDGYTIDDRIVRIVPKELFFIAGEHFYIGREYGFFVKVVTQMAFGVSYEADVLVFDVYNAAPSFPNNPTGTCKITPKFNWRYTVLEKSFSDWYNIDPSLSQLVTVAIGYDQAELFLDDIGIKVSLENPDALNEGDIGYIAEEDDGAFIIQSRVNVKGVGLKKKGQSFLADTVGFAFGYVPIVGDVLSALSYVTDLYNGFGRNGYLYSRDVTMSNNEANIQTYETNNTDQIRVRNHLIKSEAVTIKSNSSSPRLINVGGYAEFKYVVARRSNSDYNKFRIVTSISANALEDNTTRYWLFTWIEDGEAKNFGRTTGTYETSIYQRLNTVNFNNGGTTVSVPASKYKLMIKYVPKIGGTYRLETISSIGDPNFCIRNATRNTDEVYAIDNIIGRNARLIIDLIAGDIYYITAMNDDRKYGYSLRIGFEPASSNSMFKDNPYNMNISANSYMMAKFSPTATGYYDFYTQLTLGDPFINLFDENGNLMASDDDALGSLNSLIRAYLIAGNTYFLAGQGYNGKASVYSVQVIPSISERLQVNLNLTQTINVSTTICMYEFVAPYSETYDFFTYDRTVGDPYLELYDSNRKKIAYNDDGNGDRNSLMTVTLTAGEKYYVNIRGFANSTTSCKFQIRLSLSNRTEVMAGLNSSIPVSVDIGNVKVFKFVAKESKYYTIYTEDIINGDPVLELMDSAGEVIEIDDDSGSGFNAEINFLAYEGEVYYIVCRGYKSDRINEYTLIIN